jgi:hypothetical protein
MSAARALRFLQTSAARRAKNLGLRRFWAARAGFPPGSWRIASSVANWLLAPLANWLLGPLTNWLLALADELVADELIANWLPTNW